MRLNARKRYQNCFFNLSKVGGAPLSFKMGVSQVLSTAVVTLGLNFITCSRLFPHAAFPMTQSICSLSVKKFSHTRTELYFHTLTAGCIVSTEWFFVGESIQSGLSLHQRGGYLIFCGMCILKRRLPKEPKGPLG